MAFRRFGWSARAALLAGGISAFVAAASAYAATTWVRLLQADPPRPGVPSSPMVANLTITAVATPAAGSPLYPGGTGDAVVKITNPNSFPVTITAVEAPTTYADGYRDPRLTSRLTRCSARTPSGVKWNVPGGTRRTSHTLKSPLTVGAESSLTVTLTNAVMMESSAPAACAGAYFSLPSLTGVTAARGTGPATRSPASDAWAN